jgi:hypothetical protein
MTITNTQLSTSPGPVFVSSGENAITALIFCNTSATTDATVDIWMVPAGYALGDNNKICKAISIPRSETFSIDTEKFILANGDSVQAQSTQNSVITVTLSYIQLF